MAEEHVEYLVIGSGAGAAPLTTTLVGAGKQVLMLEKGPLLLTQAPTADGVSDFKRDESFATGAEKRITTPGVANQGASFYASHVEPDLNDEPHVYREADGSERVTIEGYTAQVVGGGTQLYGGVSLRFTPDDFRLASFNAGRTDLRNDPNGDVAREARDWPISYDDLEPYYCKAEELVGLNGTRDGQEKPASVDNYQPPLEPNQISAFAAAGMDALGMKRYRTPLAVITQDHAPSGRTVPADRDTIKTAFVNRYGDPLGLKSNTWVSLLAPLRGKPNFELRANCVVTRLEADGSRISRVHYRDPLGGQRTVTADTVVVACSAMAAYIVKDWHPHDQALMDTLADQCRQILANAGPVQDLSWGSVGGSVVRIANHILGGARFGTDPNDSVLDPGCRVWNVDNLYLTDGACMPTSGGANPTLTIQANSYRVGDVLLGR